VIIRSVL